MSMYFYPRGSPGEEMKGAKSSFFGKASKTWALTGKLQLAQVRSFPVFFSCAIFQDWSSKCLEYKIFWTKNNNEKKKQK